MPEKKKTETTRQEIDAAQNLTKIRRAIPHYIKDISRSIGIEDDTIAHMWQQFTQKYFPHGIPDLDTEGRSETIECAKLQIILGLAHDFPFGFQELYALPYATLKMFHEESRKFHDKRRDELNNEQDDEDITATPEPLATHPVKINVRNGGKGIPTNYGDSEE